MNSQDYDFVEEADRQAADEGDGTVPAAEAEEAATETELDDTLHASDSDDSAGESDAEHSAGSTDSDEPADPIVELKAERDRLKDRHLRLAGVEVVDPAGEPFDPNTMEAMMRAPTESEEDDDTVAMVFQRGYTLKGLLVRPARVSVFKCQ